MRHNKDNKKVMSAIVSSNDDTVIETPVQEQERPPATGKYITVSDDDSDWKFGDTPISTQASETAMRAESRKIEEGLLNPTATIQLQSHLSNTEDDVLQGIVDAKKHIKPLVSSSPTAMHMQPSVSLASELVNTAMTEAISMHTQTTRGLKSTGAQGSVINTVPALM
jgi:hypothetical protein